MYNKKTCLTDYLQNIPLKKLCPFQGSHPVFSFRSTTTYFCDDISKTFEVQVELYKSYREPLLDRFPTTGNTGNNSMQNYNRVVAA